MRLSQFILDNVARIMQERERFARSLPPGQSPPPNARRPDAECMLRLIAAQMLTPGSAPWQANGNEGREPVVSELPRREQDIEDRPAVAQCDAVGVAELVAEHHALRASVTRLWLDFGAADPVAQARELAHFDAALDQQLSASVARMTQLERDRDVALAVIGHDLRNPLNTISMAVDVLRRSRGQESTQQEVLVRIVDAIERMNRVIERLEP